MLSARRSLSIIVRCVLGGPEIPEVSIVSFVLSSVLDLESPIIGIFTFSLLASSKNSISLAARFSSYPRIPC